MSTRRKLFRNQLKPRIERLELRQMLASDLLPGIGGALFDAQVLMDREAKSEYQFQADQEVVELNSHPNRITIGARPGIALKLPSNLTFVRDITPGVRVYESSSSISPEVISSLEALDGVDFTTTVFVDAKTSNEAVLLNEIIIALKPEIAADDFFSAQDEFSSYRPLDGTSDQYIATVKSGYGLTALNLGNAISTEPGVAWTSPNFYQTWEKFYTPNDPRFTNQWHMHNTGQGGGVIDADSDLPEAWDIVPGGSSNLVVGVIDDGVQSTHPDLNIWVNPGETAGDGIDNDGNGWVDDINGWNFVFDTTNSEPVGTDRHGTSVAGVATARGDNSLGIAGAAYRSSVMSIKMFDGNFVASDANIAAALYYAGGRTRNGAGTWRSADIVNNSWGGGSVSAAIIAALNWGTTSGRQGQGATYFFATGNNFASSVSFPANTSGIIPGVISIGATNNFAQRSNYSNFGPELDVVTPSNDLRTGYLAIDTTDRTGVDGYATGDYTGTSSATGFGGTSSASPLATGIGALVLARAQSLNEPLSPALLRSYLRTTTDLFGGYIFDINTGHNLEVGYGRLNAFAAVQGVGIPEISVVTTTSEFLSGNTFDFGSLNLGKSSSVSMRVRNQGTRPLNITDATVSGPFSIDAGLIGTSLGVGESKVLLVRFSPMTAGTHNAQVALTSNDSDESTFRINVTGFAINTAISGELFEDFVGDGIRSPSDFSIPGVTTAFAYLDSNNNNSFDVGETRTFADATGYYAFLILPNGTYTVRAVTPGWTQTAPVSGSRSITISSPTDFNLGVDFGFAKNGRMYGFGFEDLNKDGLVNSGEKGVAGQFVFLDSNRNGLLDPQATYSSTGAVAIPDLGIGTSTIAVTDSFVVEDVNVTITVPHTWMSDLDLTLISPTGVRVRLATFIGGSADGFFGTTFDDEATTGIASGSFPFTGSFRPDQSLSILDGVMSNGNWRLEGQDFVGTDVGSIVSWSVTLTGRESGRLTNSEGYVGIDLPAGNSQIVMEPVGAWEYTIPTDGIRQVNRTAGPVRGVHFGLIFGNFAPTAMALAPASVAENAAVGTQVGTLATTDPNRRDTFTYSLVSGTGSDDNAGFLIMGNRLVTNAPFDFESQNSRTVRVRTTDSGGLAFEQAFAVAITDVNEAATKITLTGNSLPENELPNTLVGTLASDDPDANDPIDFRLVSSGTTNDNGLFRIQGNRIESIVTFDKESRSTYQVRVRAADRLGLAIEQVFVINVTEINEKPHDLALSNSVLFENVTIGSIVGNLTASDVDVGDSHSFTLVSGLGADDNAKFEINASQLRTTSLLDFETTRSLSVRLRTTDAQGLWFEKPFLVSLLNVNELPTDLALSPASVSEGLGIGTKVGVLSTIDQDLFDSHRYELIDTSSFPDSDKFRIVGSEVRTAAVFKYDTKSSYLVRVRTNDQGGLTLDKNVTIQIINVNDPPTDIGIDNRSIAENMPDSTLVGNLSTFDPDGGDTFTYSLVPGVGSSDNARFLILGNQLRSIGTFDFESRSNYSIRVESRDSAGVAVQKEFAITVTNVNERPLSLSLTQNSVLENQAAGSFVGSLSTLDQDIGDSFVYSLAVGTGDQHNAKFTIVGNTLQTNETFNFEQTKNLSVRIRSTDALGLTIEQQFEILVIDVNESPLNLVVASNLVENTSVGSLIATVTASDVDLNESLTFSFSSGAGSEDNYRFTMTPNGVIRNAVGIDFESSPSLNIRVRVTDLGGLFIETAAVIAVVNENESPTGLELSSNLISENATNGTLIGHFSSFDPDTMESFVYSFAAGVGSADNAFFTLVGNELRALGSFDFEGRSSYSIRVQTRDLGNLAFEQQFEILVKDLNEGPEFIFLSNTSVLENTTTGTLVGLLSTQDVDSADMFRYALVPGNGSDDNDSFSITNDRLETSSTFDFEAKSSYTVRIRTTDRGGLMQESAFAIQILNANDLPINLQLSSTQVDENVLAGFLVGVLSATDADALDTITYRFVTGNNDNSAFSLGGAHGESLSIGATVNFETKSNYQVDIQAVDQSGNGPTRTFLISVNDLNEAIENVLLSSAAVNENQPSGTLVGLLSAVDPDSQDSHQFQLISGTGSADNNQFTISGQQLLLNATANFELQPSYSIRVLASDAGGLTMEKVLTISVVDLPESPFGLSLSNSRINENGGSNALIGSFVASDPDASDALSYSLVSGTGSNDNGFFSLQGSQLRATQSFDFEFDSSYSIRVRATDSAGLFVEEVFSIFVNNVSEAPTTITSIGTSIPENRPVGTLVGRLSTVDSDVGESYVYSFIPNDLDGDNAKFELFGDELRSKAKFNFEAQAAYQLTIRTTDSAGLFVDVPITVQVGDVAELPITAATDNASTPTDRSVIVDVLQNDSDPDGFIDPSTVTIVSFPIDGSVRVLPDGRIEFTPPTGKRDTYSFTYNVRDNDDVVSNTAMVSVKVYSAFQNQHLNLDVDADGAVTPLDVLAIINDINLFGVRTLPTNVPDTFPFVDTNGNGQADPLDVLEVVNFLNSNSSSRAGEGEQEIASPGIMVLALALSNFDSAIVDDKTIADKDLAFASMLSVDEYYRDLSLGRNRRR